jgi:hypothetical protein
LNEVIEEAARSALYFNMSNHEFYSLRLSEAMEFIEINNKKMHDANDLNCMYFGQLCAVVANFSQGKKRKKYKIQDFFKVKITVKKQTAEEQANYLLELTRQMGGTVEGW